MILENVFSINNYVGTYEIRYSENEEPLIISKEYKNSKNVELQISTKPIFKSDPFCNTYLCAELSNVKLNDDNSIIAYCNSYGLPFSSLKILDNQRTFTLMGLELPEKEYAKINPDYQHDTILKNEFCIHATTIHNMFVMMECLHQSNLKNKNVETDNLNNLLNAFLSLLLFNPYEYNTYYSNSKAATSSLRFHDYFISFSKSHDYINGNTPLDVLIFSFLKDYCQLSRNATTSNSLGDDWCDYGNTHWNNLKELLQDIFLNNKIKAFSQTSYGSISIELASPLLESTKKNLFTQASRLLCDISNEFLTNIHPTLAYDSKNNISSDWLIRSQFEGIILEFFFIVARGTLFKKCANPTCNNYYPALAGSPTKKYCCHNCALLEAKRRERRRKREAKARI